MSLCVLSEGGLQCHASVSGWSLLWWLALAINQIVPVCLAIIRDCLWTSKGFSIVTDVSPILQKLQNLEASMTEPTEMARVP